MVYQKPTKVHKYSTVAGITYTYRNSFYQTHSVRAEYSSSWISDSISLKNPNYFGEGIHRQRYKAISYQFVSEHRDVVAYPLTGYQTIALLTKAGLGLGDDINKLDISASYSRYLDLKKGFYFSNFSNAFWSSLHGVPYANYSALGYKKQFVKGYEVYVIEGPYAFLNKSTLKKRLYSKKINWQLMPSGFEYIPLAIYLKTYCDLGYVKNYDFYRGTDQNTMLSDKLLMDWRRVRHCRFI